MRMIEPSANLGGNVERHLQSQRFTALAAPRQHLSQSRTRDELGGKKVGAARRNRHLTQVEHVNDVRVTQAQSQLRAFDETLDEVGVTAQGVVQALDDERFLEAFDA